MSERYDGPPLRVEYDHGADLLIVDGREYNGDMFRQAAAHRLRICIECGERFMQRDGREKFCRPDRARPSRCAMRWRKREQRKRAKKAGR